MTPTSRYCCHACGQILAQRRAAMLILRVPAIVIADGRVRLMCSGCGKLVWLRLPEGTAAKTI